MPIYAYRCSDCGYQNDYLQKISDPLLTECPECGKSTFKKQVTAAGFQLKGSGWYVTDFRDNGKKAKSGPAKEEPKESQEPKESKSGGDKGAGDSSSSSADSGSKTASSGGAGATPS
jgi:putative FmdB family regulatory protein